MAKVIKHQSKDGSLHNSAKECDAHDRKLRIAPAMEKFVGSLTGDTPGLTNSEDQPPESPFYIDLAHLPQFLADHAEQIRDAINGALIVRKPRKNKVIKPAAPVANPAA